MEFIPLKLDPVTVAALRRYCVEDGESIDALIRDAIKRDLRRRTIAKSAVRPDEQFIAPLRARLADDFNYAHGWCDLAARLERKGYRLAEAGGGLILNDLKGARQCKVSDLGHAYASLCRRFSAPFPGHSHPWIFERATADANRAPDRSDAREDDFDVIEDA